MEKLLVANRGEIARRIIRAARARGIGTVAVYSDADVDAPHVLDADESVRLPGTSPADTYLRIDLVVDAARRSGCDAVHPGYGFLAENAGFAAACRAADLVFVGPSSTAIKAMGDKLQAKALLAAGSVPMLPSVELDPTDAEPALGLLADLVGFPALIKAAAGGGGRGMRVVEAPADLAPAVEAAANEARRAFGDARVFVERYLPRARHVEVQVVADRRGRAVALFDRDCSLQRRHQKVVEEAPAPGLSADLRRAMAGSAIAVANAIQYEGLGTVEFLVQGDDFFFLEVNTRLQVEHPVTELVTGLDLVGLQLDLATGADLPAAVLAAEVTGHAIEVRLCAEDPGRGFTPQTGTLSVVDLPHQMGARVDSGVEQGTEVSPFYDSLLAKIIVHGADREQARKRMRQALRSTALHGVVTNVQLLKQLIDHPDFVAVAHHTGTLEGLLAAGLLSESSEPVAGGLAACAAADLHGEGWWAHDPRLLRWRNVPSEPVRTTVVDDAGLTREVTVEAGPAGPSLAVDGQRLDAQFHRVNRHMVDVTIDGVRRRYTTSVDGEEWYASSPAVGTQAFRLMRQVAERTADESEGATIAPMPGVVREVVVEPGASVDAGDLLVMIESMKLECPVCAPVAGVITDVLVREGDAVDAGTELVRLKAEDPA